MGTYQNGGYIPGGTYGTCPRCGLDRRLNDLRLEWTNLRVCADTCWDPKPPELTPPHIYPEGLVRPDAQPEPAPNYADPMNPIRQQDL